MTPKLRRPYLDIDGSALIIYNIVLCQKVSHVQTSREVIYSLCKLFQLISAWRWSFGYLSFPTLIWTQGLQSNLFGGVAWCRGHALWLLPKQLKSLIKESSINVFTKYNDSADNLASNNASKLLKRPAWALMATRFSLLYLQLSQLLKRIYDYTIVLKGLC